MIIPVILKIRWMQFLRFLKELGFVRIVVLFPFIGIVLFIFYISVLESNRLNLTFAIVTISLLNIHFSRNDKNFLKKITPKPFLIYWSEYVLLFSPVLFLYAFSHHWRYFEKKAFNTIEDRIFKTENNTADFKKLLNL